MQNCIRSPLDKNPLGKDPIMRLMGVICVVFVSSISFCARLVGLHNNKLWFETKSGQYWMIRRRAVTDILPLHHAPGVR